MLLKEEIRVLLRDMAECLQHQQNCLRPQSSGFHDRFQQLRPQNCISVALSFGGVLTCRSSMLMTWGGKRLDQLEVYNIRDQNGASPREVPVFLVISRLQKFTSPGKQQGRTWIAEEVGKDSSFF